LTKKCFFVPFRVGYSSVFAPEREKGTSLVLELLLLEIYMHNRSFRQ